MIKRNRKGVIGFLLTMAVGIALGAAALVVSSEIHKDTKESALSQTKTVSSPASVEKAFENYQRAYKAYQQAVGLGREDVQKYADAYRDAKKKLEIEIFRNTPGVSEMDMSKFDGKTAPGKPVSSVSTSNSSQGNAPVIENAANPFGESEIILTDNDYSVTVSQSSEPPTSGNEAQAVTSVENSSQGSTSGNATTSNQASAASKNNESKITGMEYYRVKSGDSLSKICEKYYGDSGMWTHILKYQIPAIAATPNLIFPGQLIVLPKGFSADRNSDSFVTSNNGNSGSTNSQKSQQTTGSHEIAPAGDESWQTKFQKDYVVSDRTLTDTNTMTVAQIQSFLDKKGSCLAKPYNGSTPAQMIFNAAKKFGINPQVLLTRLQCEQGLISKKSATQKQLDWALGVGCYDSGNWNQSFKGLDKQIEFAASTYRRHFDNAQARIKSGEKITMTIDGQSVTLKNAATYSFYKYCPHFQGNKLFFDVWNGYKKSF